MDQQAVAEDTDVEDQFTSTSPTHESHIRPPSVTDTVLSKLSPLEPSSGITEQEISPAVEFPSSLTPHSQVHVGVSPTEDFTSYRIPSLDLQVGRTDIQETGKQESLQTEAVTISVSQTEVLTQESTEFSADSSVDTGLPTLPPLPLYEFYPSAPPPPPDETFETSTPDMTSGEISDRSDTESIQTSAATVIHKSDLDIQDKDQGDGVPSASGAVISSRGESLDQELSIKSESQEISSTVLLSTTKSPTSSMISPERTESTESEGDFSTQQSAQMAFDNRAFAGVEHIDEVSMRPEAPSSVFDLPKEHLQDGTELSVQQLKEQEKAFKKDIFSVEMQEIVEDQTSSLERKPIFLEEEKVVERHMKMEILMDELDRPSAPSSLEEKEIVSEVKEVPSQLTKDVPSQLTKDELDKQERIDHQIRSDIFSHELEEAIETQQPEVKEIISGTDDGAEQFVALRMKSDILSEELAQGMDDQSPEQKYLPKIPSKDSSFEKLLHSEPVSKEDVTVITPTRSASEIPAETVLWEVPVQEQPVPDTIETTEEIPAHKQVIIERDEEEMDEEEESEPETANIEEVEKSVLESLVSSQKLSAIEARQIAEEIVEEIKTEVSKRPPLRHIPSEISEEDLVERFGGSPDHDIIGQHKMNQHFGDDRKSKFIATETSSIDITDEELQASSDELSPVEQHRERLESMTVEENLRRQSFVQLSEEHLLSEMQWKATKGKDTEDQAKEIILAEKLETSETSSKESISEETIVIEKSSEASDTLLRHVESKESSEEKCLYEDSERLSTIVSDVSQTDLQTKTEQEESISEMKELYSLEKDRERRTKQEQEFHQLVKLRRERVEQSREKDSSKVFGKSDSLDKKDRTTDESSNGSGGVEYSLHISERKEQIEASSSSGESHYYSAIESDSSHTSRGTPGTSRPCSSDLETLVTSGQGSSEYDTCITSEETTYRTAPTSQDYVTAASSLSHSSRESMRSIDSESSGHMGSVEISSEASETLVPSALEMERDTETPTIDDDKYFAAEHVVKEPYETEIPEHVIRGEKDFADSLKMKSYPFDTSPYGLKMDRMTESVESTASISTIIGTDGQSRPREDIQRDLSLEERDGDGREEAGSPFELILDSELDDLKERDEFEMAKTEVLHKKSEKMETHYSEKQHVEVSSEEQSRILSTSSSSQVSIKVKELHGKDIEVESSSKERLLSTIVRTSTTESSLESGQIESLVSSSSVMSHDTRVSYDLVDVVSSCVTTLPVSADTSGDLLDDLSVSPLVASAPPAEDEDLCQKESEVLVKSTILPESQNVYSQVNGPVEVEFVPEYDVVPDDGYTSETISASYGTSSIVCPITTRDISAPDATEAKEDIVHESQWPPDVVPIHHQLIGGIPIPHRSDVSDDELSDVGSVQDEQNIQESHVVRELQELHAISTPLEDDTYRFEQSEREDEEMGCSGYHLTKDLTPGHSFVLRQELELDRPESELRDLDSSRPHSHAESDSDQRPFSELQFSDDRPDSELTEIMKQTDISEEKEVSEEIERPPSPEPLDEYEIKEEFEESTIRKSPVDMSAGTSASPALITSTYKDDLTSPREKHEFETSERSPKEKGMVTLAVDIPDITVTQHVTPTVDKRYHFPGYEDVKDDLPIGRLVEEEEVDDDVDDGEGVKESASYSPSAKPLYQEKVIPPKPSTSESEDSSESFEMVEKFDVPEMVPEKLESFDLLQDKPSVERDEFDITMDMPSELPSTYSPTSIKPIEVVYYPDDGSEDEKKDVESGTMEKGEYERQEKEVVKESSSRSVESTQFRDVEMDAEKWMEMQFEESEASSSILTSSGYHYQMNFEREYDDRSEFYPRDEELEDIIEEGEKQDDEDDEKIDMERFKESISSTPEYDFLAARKFFSKSGENDDVSVSSLQEFEKLETELARGDRRLSSDSQESLNGRRSHGRSGQGDDASVTSLQEFERLEKECADADKIERMAQEEAARLSEIEEGHESQASEAESQETLSDQGPGDDSDSDDYEKRMFEIDEIIKQAQSNVELFETEKSHDRETKPLEKDSDKSKIDSASVESGEGTESSLVDKTPSPKDGDDDDDDDGGDGDDDSLSEKEDEKGVRSTDMHALQQYDQSSYLKDLVPHDGDGIAGGTGVDSRSSFLEESSTYDGHRSYEGHPYPQQEYTVGGSTEFQQDHDHDSLNGDDRSGPAKDGDGDADSLQGNNGYQGGKDDCDSDSLKDDGESPAGEFHKSRTAHGEFDRDSLCGGTGGGGREMKVTGKGVGDAMVSSTDSLEPSSSTATHATYQYETDSIMSSSFTSMQTSGEESTMVSSTDTMELEQKNSVVHTQYSPPDSRFEDSKHFLDQESLKCYMDMEGNVQTDLQFATLTTTESGFVDSSAMFTDTEGNLQESFQSFSSDKSDDTRKDPFVRTVHRSVIMEPDVRTVTFAGPDADTKIEGFISKFQPGDDIMEVETSDELGNVHVTRAVQRRIIVQPRVTTISFAGPAAEQEIQEYLNQTTSSEFAEFSSAFEDMSDKMGKDKHEQEAEEKEIETETFETTDEFGTVRRVIRRKITSHPDVRTISFSGRDAQKEMEDFMKSSIPGFDPGSVTEEMITQDEHGNTVKVVKHTITTTDSGKSAETFMTSESTSPLKSVTKTTTTASFTTTKSSYDSPLAVGSPKKSPIPKESPPSSPTVSSSSHSEDCYCGPEAEPSAHCASIGLHRPGRLKH